MRELLLQRGSFQIRLSGIVAATAAPITHGQTNAENVRQRWHLGILMVILIAIAIWYLRSRKKPDEVAKPSKPSV